MEKNIVDLIIQILDKLKLKPYQAILLIGFIIIFIVLLITLSPKGHFPYLNWIEFLIWSIIIFYVLVINFIIFPLILGWKRLLFVRIIILLFSGLIGSLIILGSLKCCIHRSEAFHKRIGICIARFKNDPNDSRRGEIFRALNQVIEGNEMLKEVEIRKINKRIYGEMGHNKSQRLIKTTPPIIMVIWGEFPSPRKVHLCISLKVDDIIARVPSKFGERIDKIMLALGYQSKGQGLAELLYDKYCIGSPYDVVMSADLTKIDLPDEILNEILFLLYFYIASDYLTQGEYVEAIHYYELSSQIQGLNPIKKGYALAYLSYSKCLIGIQCYLGELKKIEFPSRSDQKAFARIHFYGAINLANNAYKLLEKLANQKDTSKHIKVSLALLSTVEWEISGILIRDIYEELLECTAYYQNSYILNDEEFKEIVHNFRNSNEFKQVKKNLLRDCDYVAGLIFQFNKLVFHLLYAKLPYPIF